MKIRIGRKFNAFGPAFEGIYPGNEYEVISVSGDDVWIQGNGEPIKILNGEYKIIE